MEGGKANLAPLHYVQQLVGEVEPPEMFALYY